MEITFGKYKGKTVKEIMQTERGKGWLSWYISNAKSDTTSQYYEKNLKTANAILEAMEEGRGNSSSTPGGGASPASSAVNSQLNDVLADIIIRLDRIEKLLASPKAEEVAKTFGGTPEDIVWEE